MGHQLLTRKIILQYRDKGSAFLRNIDFSDTTLLIETKNPTSHIGAIWEPWMVVNRQLHPLAIEKREVGLYKKILGKNITYKIFNVKLRGRYSGGLRGGGGSCGPAPFFLLEKCKSHAATYS